MKEYVGIELLLYALLVFSKDECERSGLCPGSFTLREQHTSTNCAPQTRVVAQSFNNMFKISLCVHFLSKTSPIHILPSSFFTIHFHTILPPTLSSSKCCFSFMFPHQYPQNLFYSVHTTCFNLLALLHFITLIIFDNK